MKTKVTTMKATFEIIKGQIETIEGLQNIVEVMHNEGIESTKLDDGRVIEVYGNGTYRLNEFMNALKKRTESIFKLKN
jgi:hypothetical protein